MAEIIDLTKVLKEREEKEIERLSSKLAGMIEELGATEDFEMYMDSIDDSYLGIPHIYTMYTPYYMKSLGNYNPEKVKSLSDITDVLTKLTLQLDEMGYTKWADQISNVVGEMFTSGSFNES